MIRGIREVKEAGHRGAQKEAKTWANEEWPKSVRRQNTLDFMEMAGYGRFLLGGEDQELLAPLASGRKVSDEGESWTTGPCTPWPSTGLGLRLSRRMI